MLERQGSTYTFLDIFSAAVYITSSIYVFSHIWVHWFKMFFQALSLTNTILLTKCTHSKLKHDGVSQPNDPYISRIIGSLIRVTFVVKIVALQVERPCCARITTCVSNLSSNKVSWCKLRNLLQKVEFKYFLVTSSKGCYFRVGRTLRAAGFSYAKLMLS